MVINAEEHKILIVDDEGLVRRAIRKRLAREGYQCYEANNAPEALEKLQVDQPHLVLLDVKMPGRTGLEILPEINTLYPNTAVIMATAIVEAEVIIECMRGGAQDYITKPFDLDQVVESIDKALEMKQLEHRIREYQQQLEHTVEEQKGKIREIFMGSIESLVYALEAKDQYTAGHSRRVTSFAIATGENLGLLTDELDNLRWAALLHDVGKIAIDPSIQNKPDRLTIEEYRHMMTHALVGAGIARPVSGQEIINIIAHHHDRYDGKGLDQMTLGDKIPLGSRIIVVADSFDAMTSDRPYRAAMSDEDSIAEMKRCTGTQFDPVIVDAFLQIISRTRAQKYDVWSD
ncbi:HD domain-containing phosphohydrolase [Chloroflexota bacterium]